MRAATMEPGNKEILTVHFAIIKRRNDEIFRKINRKSYMGRIDNCPCLCGGIICATWIANSNTGDSIFRAKKNIQVGF